MDQPTTVPAYWADFNDLWDYSDPAATEMRFRELLNDDSRAPEYVLELKTQLARTMSLRGLFAEAHALLDEVEPRMQADSLVQVRYLLERGRAFNSGKKAELAVPLFLQAAQLGEKLGLDFYTVDALHMLGIAAPGELQLAWNLKAIDAAQKSRDGKARGWLASLYNNTGWALYDLARYEEALDLFRKSVPLRIAQGKAKEAAIAKWSVGKVLRAMGKPQEALQIQRELEAGGKTDGFTSEELAECLYALGEENEAKPYFAKAYEQLAQIDWVAEDTARISRLKSMSEA
jgi:tetratricopeptide (TPR) repeat protein